MSRERHPNSKVILDQYRKDFEESRLEFAHAEDFNDDVHDLIERRNIGTPLYFTPQMKFRKGGVTVWGGESNVGKSMLTGQVAQWLVRNGQKVVLISLEMPPDDTLRRMFQQAIGRPDEKGESPYYDEWSHTTDEDLVILKPGGRITPETILGACGWVCEKEIEESGKPVSHIIIDNLMCVVKGEDDLTGQKMLVFGLAQVAQDRGIHVHLVHHLRKAEKSSQPRRVTKDDLKGSGAIADRANNVLMLMFNPDLLKAEEEYRVSHFGAEMPPLEKQKFPDRLLLIAKSRDGAGVGKYTNLWFDSSSLCFCTDRGLTQPVLYPRKFEPIKAEHEAKRRASRAA